MLIQRVATALVLLPLLLAAIWWLPTQWLYVVFCGAGLVAAWEWAGLMRPPAPTPALRASFVLICAGLMAVAWIFRSHAVVVCALAGLWWLVALVFVRGFPDRLPFQPNRFSMSLIGALMLVSTMLALWVLREMPNGPWRLVFLFFLVFAADIGAYLAGRNFGRRKLAPQVSPGKTLEGMLGGLVLCALWAACAGPLIFWLDSPRAWAELVLLSVAIAAFTVVGDLIESLFKRRAGVKDSGSILPGHGGMLDRVDSILAGAPLLALGLIVLNI